MVWLCLGNGDRVDYYHHLVAVAVYIADSVISHTFNFERVFFYPAYAFILVRRLPYEEHYFVCTSTLPFPSTFYRAMLSTIYDIIIYIYEYSAYGTATDGPNTKM